MQEAGLFIEDPMCDDDHTPPSADQTGSAVRPTKRGLGHHEARPTNPEEKTMDLDISQVD